MMVSLGEVTPRTGSILIDWGRPLSLPVSLYGLITHQKAKHVCTQKCFYLCTEDGLCTR